MELLLSSERLPCLVYSVVTGDDDDDPRDPDSSLLLPLEIHVCCSCS